MSNVHSVTGFFLLRDEFSFIGEGFLRRRDVLSLTGERFVWRNYTLSLTGEGFLCRSDMFVKVSFTGAILSREEFFRLSELLCIVSLTGAFGVFSHESITPLVYLFF